MTFLLPEGHVARPPRQTYPDISVLVADDHPMTRAGLRSLLSDRCGVATIVEATNGEQAVASWSRFRPNIGLIDLRMPLLDGLQVVRAIRSKQPTSRLVLLTASCTGDDVYLALQEGAAGFMLKDADADELHRCFVSVLAGLRYLSTVAAAKLAGRMFTTPLTQRELSILKLIAQGLSNKSIALHFDIAEGTVKTHVKSMLQKFGAKTRTELTCLAIQRGLINVPAC